MTDRDTRPGGEGPSPERADRDVNVRAIVWFGVILGAIAVLGGIVGTFVVLTLESSQERRDPEPLPIREAAEPVLPPGPRLQASPEEDLEAMLEQEEARLERYSLAEGGEHARIPIERAMELILERGLGSGGTGEEEPFREAPRPEDGMPPAAGPVGAGVPLADAARAGSRPGRLEDLQATEGQHAQ